MGRLEKQEQATRDRSEDIERYRDSTTKWRFRHDGRTSQIAAVQVSAYLDESEASRQPAFLTPLQVSAASEVQDYDMFTLTRFYTTEL